MYNTLDKKTIQMGVRRIDLSRQYCIAVRLPKFKPCPSSTAYSTYRTSLSLFAYLWDGDVHSCHLLFDHFQFALIHGTDIPGSYAILLFTASDLASITSHIHSWVLFLLWLHPFILSGVISGVISPERMNWYAYCSKCHLEFNNEGICPWILVFREILFTDSISFLFRFSISSWFCLCGLYISMNVLISSWLSICWHKWLKAVSYVPLDIFDISNNASFLFLIYLICNLSSFFLVLQYIAFPGYCFMCT